MTEHTHCPDQQAGEPTPEYASRVLRYALTYGIQPLTMSQLETADNAAQLAVCALPAALNQDAARLDTTLHALRLRLACRMAEKRRQLAAINRALEEMTPSPSDADEQPGQPGQAPESDADRAARLLRAALTLIRGNGNGSQGGGGRPAYLQPPAPVRPGPPGGLHVDDRPTLPAKDGIAF